MSVAALVLVLATIRASTFNEGDSSATRGNSHMRYQSLAALTQLSSARRNQLDTDTAREILERLLQVRIGTGLKPDEDVNAHMPWQKFKTAKLAVAMAAAGMQPPVVAKDGDAELPWKQLRTANFAQQLAAVVPGGGETAHMLASESVGADGFRPGADPDAKMPWQSRFAAYVERLTEPMPEQTQLLVSARSSNAHMPWAKSRFGDFVNRVASGRVVPGSDQGVSATVADAMTSGQQTNLAGKFEQLDGIDASAPKNVVSAGSDGDEGLATAYTNTQMLPASTVEIEGADNGMTPPGFAESTGRQLKPKPAASLATVPSSPAISPALMQAAEAAAAAVLAAGQKAQATALSTAKTGSAQATPATAASQLYAPQSIAEAVGKTPIVQQPIEQQTHPSIEQIAAAQQPISDLAVREKQSYIGHFPWDREQRNRLFASHSAMQMYAPDARTTAGVLPYDFADQNGLIGQGGQQLAASDQSSVEFKQAMQAYKLAQLTQK